MDGWMVRVDEKLLDQWVWYELEYTYLPTYLQLPRYNIFTLKRQTPTPAVSIAAFN